MNAQGTGSPVDERGRDVADLREAASGLLDREWGTAVAAGAPEAPERLAGVEVRGRDQGWFELGDAGGPDFLLAVVAELGRRSCPLPLADAYLATRWASDLAPDLVPGLSSGAARPAVVLRGGEPGLVDHPVAPTHLLTVDPETGELWCSEVTRAVPVGGLAAHAWHQVQTRAQGDPVALGHHELEHALGVLRLAVATRAVEAAGRAHRLAVEHAASRRQFGRAVGAFGAVQQRSATAEIELTAARALVEQAAQALVAGVSSAGIACALAARFAADAAPSVLTAAQHTLGAIGYFEEHEVAWLFRTVHADTTRLRGELGDRGRTGAAGRLLGGEALPPLALGERAEAFRGEVRLLLDRHRTGTGFAVEALRQEMAAARLFSLGWPEESGGRPASVEEQVVLHEELKYDGGPVDRAMSASMLIGHALLEHGSVQQQATYLPLVADGRMAFCLGYSEPDAGSDLASLRTRAVRDGDHWVVDGQKSWTTRAHTASHVWLAVRTDPEAVPRHAGITILLVPMDTPGITVQEHRALSGEVSCTVFYDGVRVPDSCRVGEVGGGWRVITGALASERVVMGGVAAVLRRRLDEALDLLRAGPDPVDDVRRDLLGRVAARLQAARVLVLAATRARDDARRAGVVGAMAAVLAGDLAEELGRVCLDLLGPRALLGAGEAGALGDGAFESALRLAPMFVIGGGTNDVQRALVARSLGLPRE